MNTGRTPRLHPDLKRLAVIRTRKNDASNNDNREEGDGLSHLDEHSVDEKDNMSVSSFSSGSSVSNSMSGEIQSYIQNSSGRNRLPVPKKSFKGIVGNEKLGSSGFNAGRHDDDNGIITDESRKEAREAFLRSETMGLSKKLDPAAVNQDQNNISSNHEKDALSQKYSTNSTAPIISLPSINHSATSTTVASNRSKSFKEQESYVGFANLPNQVYRKSVKRGFEFTLMLVGESGLGKSTLMNSMFLTDLYNAQYPGPSLRSQKTVKVEKMQVVLKEGGVQLKLTVVDTPGFGDSVDNTNCWKPIIDYIDEQYNLYLNAESRVIRQVTEDTRVHCCLYFISPNGHGLKPLDIEVMKQLHEKVNIIPLISKADSMTVEECKNFKKIIMDEIAQHSIKIYEFPDCEDEDEQKVMKKMKERIPFAVVGSNTVIEVGGKKVRARSYPWGVVEVENLEHNDFLSLRNMLIRTHLHDLKDVTNNVHYENFRYDKLLTSVGTEKGGKVSLDKSPLLQIEEEKKEHEEKLKRMEAEMHTVFEAKVQEKKNKLQESDTELRRRQEQMMKSLEQQEAEFLDMKKVFIAERDTWEEQIKQHEAELTSTLKKKKTLFS